MITFTRDDTEHDEEYVLRSEAEAAIQAAVEQANARQNAAWRLMCDKMVAAEREQWETVVFDGWAVLKGLDAIAAKRTTHQNVSDTLDALMRVLRA